MKRTHLLVLVLVTLVGCNEKNPLVESTVSESNLNTDVNRIKVQLREMAEADQEVRNEFDAVFADRDKNPEANLAFKTVYKRMREQDIAHHKTLSSIVDVQGWIDPDRFGKKASQDAWLITQHMVHDKGVFQKKMLSFMQPGVNVESMQYALLSDRIAVIFDKSAQEYGTQGKCQKNGVWQVSPIRNFDNLDERRLEIGFEVFADYETRMNAKCLKRISKSPQ